MSELSDRLVREPDYRPYCLACNTMARMRRTERGFICDPTFTEEPRLIGGRIIFGRVGCGCQITVDPTP